MRKFAIILTASAALLLAASAFAALPQKGKFSGTTNARGMGGFKDGVTFSAINGGKTLHNFSFGTLGCFGVGSFSVGVDPYALATSVGTVQTIQLTPKGTFLVTTKPHFVDRNDTTTTAIIQGAFTSGKLVTGTISISQVDDQKDTCGPVKMKFTAAPGAADTDDLP